MKHVKALLIKFIGSLALLYIILGVMYEMTFGEVLILSAVLGVVAYVIGDMLILPRTNNAVATTADFGLAWILIYWFLNGMTFDVNAFTASLPAALGVSLFELFFHRYLANNILLNEERNPRSRNLQYQTEISEELGKRRSKRK
ncbi:YndM family protein [Oceanobacillus senegalensis]|uniref:YndM family protein n=1 Tax=Oceanobacillus senegalensis TaxID=1936063 RepID=UPI000A30C766|nr:YndM family protein [Oceanobacillus senegalensis]